MGSFLNLFLAASMPVLDVLLITIIGLFLALKNIDILGENARHHLNTLVFYIFNPALVTSNLAKTITFQSFLTLWFMPINILITFVVGSILGWLLGKVTRAPRHINGLILASCSAGNLGSLVLIIVPAICKEKGSPFGAPDICKTHGLGYASLSMAIGMIYLWLYVYNILRISSKEVNVNTGSETNGYGTKKEPSDETSVNVTETECDLSSLETRVVASPNSHSHSSSSKFEVALSYKIERCLRSTSKRMKLKELLAPSTIGAIVGFFIGMISPFRKLLIGDDAPLHVVGDTVSMLADASIPCITLILGANLLKGVKGSGVRLVSIIGIIAVRYIILPLIGVMVIKGAVRTHLVPSHDSLFQFVLLLQYALPPAMGIGTITQAFGAGQSECSVIMLWTYALAPVALTLWSTLFLWLVTHHF